MARRLRVVLAGFGLAAVVAALMWIDREDAVAPIAPSAADSPTSETSAAGELGHTAAVPVAEVSRAGVQARASISAGPGATARGREEVVLRGTLARGADPLRAVPGGDGSFLLSVWSPPEPEASGDPEQDRRKRLRDRHVVPVEVRNGRWEACVPVHASRHFSVGRLEDLPLTELRVAEVAGSSPGELEIRVAGLALHPARLRVVDAASQRDLQDVHVVRLEAGDLRGHPGSQAEITAVGPSPIELAPPATARAGYLIGAAGHAWRRVEWDHLAVSPVPRVVELELGGDVTFAIHSDLPLEHLALILTIPPERSPWARLDDLERGAHELRDLGEGSYRAALVPRIASIHDLEPELAWAAVHIAAGELVQVALEAGAGDAPARVRLAGRVRFARTWSAGGPHLVVQGLGRTAVEHAATGGRLGGLTVEAEGDEWSFSSPQALAKGRYAVIEQCSGSFTTIEVGPWGTDDVRIEIPDPVEVLIEVRDADSDAPVFDVDVRLLPVEPSEASHAPALRPRFEAGAAAGTYLGRVPLGDRLELEVSAAGYESTVAPLTIEGLARESVRVSLRRD